MLIDWSAERLSSPAVSEQADSSPVSSEAADCEAKLPEPRFSIRAGDWDFVTVFPPPLDEAIDAGVLDESDAAPQAVQSMTAVYACESLALLFQRDAEARLHTQQRTNDRPSPAEQLQRRFEALILTYADAFGEEAARAFESLLVERHSTLSYTQRLAITSMATLPSDESLDLDQASAGRVKHVTSKSGDSPTRRR
jgi:hypothetical protein